MSLLRRDPWWILIYSFNAKMRMLMFRLPGSNEMCTIVSGQSPAGICDYSPGIVSIFLMILRQYGKEFLHFSRSILCFDPC